MDSDARTSPGRAATVRYRWCCPRCDASKGRLFVHTRAGASGATARERFEKQVANDLESHLRAAEGGGHGPSGSRPRELDRDDLLDHVERCDPRAVAGKP